MSTPRKRNKKNENKKKTRTLDVGALARVEGEGALYVKIRDDEIEDVKLRIYEPPRFFEAFLRGRKFTEAPDITARICGICPVAYQMSSAQAMEAICGVEVGGQLRALRRLIYCGEWIESHALHIYMLHAPDFLGYEDAIRLAEDHPEVVQRGLKLKKIGNDLMTLLGGREIHPINPRVGGFYRVPTTRELNAVVEDLKWAQEAAYETVRWTGTFEFPDFEQDYEFVALRHPDEYPITEGRIVSNKGIDIALEEFEEMFIEEHVEHSTALQAYVKGRGAYHTGPMARYNLSFDKLSPLAQQAAKEAGLGRECRNPFQSIVVRGVETLYACEEALRIIREYEPPERPFIDVEPRAGTGHGCTEAPRGILYHRYTIDGDGVIQDARIVPPTAQNQRMMEEDLRAFIVPRLELPDAELQWQCEQVVRNYDPCISCSAHFLKLHLERE